MPLWRRIWRWKTGISTREKSVWLTPCFHQSCFWNAVSKHHIHYTWIVYMMTLKSQLGSWAWMSLQGWWINQTDWIHMGLPYDTFFFPTSDLRKNWFHPISCLIWVRTEVSAIMLLPILLYLKPDGALCCYRRNNVMPSATSYFSWVVI